MAYKRDKQVSNANMQYCDTRNVYCTTENEIGRTGGQKRTRERKVKGEVNKRFEDRSGNERTRKNDASDWSDWNAKKTNAWSNSARLDAGCHPPTSAGLAYSALKSKQDYCGQETLLQYIFDRLRRPSDVRRQSQRVRRFRTTEWRWPGAIFKLGERLG